MMTKDDGLNGANSGGQGLKERLFMKIKRNRNPGGVVMELGPHECQFPGAAAEDSPKAVPPIEIKRIMVPTDFSNCSKKALHYALHLARQFDARLWLIHVRQVSYYVPDLAQFDMSEANPDRVTDAEDRLAALAREETMEGISVETLVCKGEPVREIVGAAREFDVDLIVVSTHGYTGLKHLLHGSVAEKLARYAPCPVLVVGDEEHDFVA